MPTLNPLGDIARHGDPAIVDRSGTPDALPNGPHHFSRAAAVLFTGLAVVMALWILASTILMVLQGQVSIPINDDWDRFITYVANHYSIEWFFHPHVDHRLVAPKILFMIDDRVFY